MATPTIQQRLKRLQKQINPLTGKPYTVRGLAKRLNLSPSQVSCALRGGKAGYKTETEVAKAEGV